MCQCALAVHPPRGAHGPGTINPAGTITANAKHWSVVIHGSRHPASKFEASRDLAGCLSLVGGASRLEPLTVVAREDEACLSRLALQMCSRWHERLLEMWVRISRPRTSIGPCGHWSKGNPSSCLYDSCRQGTPCCTSCSTKALISNLTLNFFMQNKSDAEVYYCALFDRVD
jgi:hypothetical protein